MMLELAPSILLVISASFSATILLLHSIYGFTAMRTQLKKPLPNLVTYPLVAVIVPAKREPIDLIERVLHSLIKLDYPRDKLKIILVCDDYTAEEQRAILNIVSRLRELIDIEVLFRKSGKYKASALNHALKHVDADYIAIIDVDNVITPEFLKRAVSYLTSDTRIAAYTCRWTALNTDDSTVSRAIALSQDFMFNVLMRGRYALSLRPFILGTGSVIRKCVLDEIGGFPESIIEDLDLSLEVMMRGYQIHYDHDSLVYVEVPTTYASFRKQQIRWVYGTTYLIINKLPKFFKSKEVKLREKIDVLLYLSQYVGAMLILLTLFALTLTVAYVRDVQLWAFYIALILWVLSSVAYITVFYMFTRRMEISFVKAIKLLGASSIMITLMSPCLLISTLKCLLRIPQEWTITPKGSARWFYTSFIHYLPEICVAVVSVAIFIGAVMRGLVYTALTVLPVVIAYIRGLLNLALKRY